MASSSTSVRENATAPPTTTREEQEQDLDQGIIHNQFGEYDLNIVEGELADYMTLSENNIRQLIMKIAGQKFPHYINTSRLAVKPEAARMLRLQNALFSKEYATQIARLMGNVGNNDAWKHPQTITIDIAKKAEQQLMDSPPQTVL